MDQLILLPEEEAVQRHFDRGNYTVLRRLMLALMLLLPVAAFFFLVVPSWHRLALVLADLGAVWALFSLRHRPVFERSFRRFLLAFLLLQFLVAGLVAAPGQEGWRTAAFLLPVLALLLRIKTEEYLLLLGTSWGTVFLIELIGPLLDQGTVYYELLVGLTLDTGVLLTISVAITRRLRREFLEQWRRDRQRHRERTRMRQELESAKRIQLQMLPRQEPQVGWLDISSLSLPATEVGGDYYDYFPLSPTKLALVVGDVAGHGVGSGILLSGVRSCLYLLHEYEADSQEIMQRLDHIVKQTTSERMFFTLLYAVFDAEAKTLTVSTAGHPPGVFFSPSTSRLEELGTPALPLGTGLATRPSVQTVPFTSGDTFVFYTDGLSEVTDARGSSYGYERLFERVARLAPEKGSRALREALLLDIWSFKGDSEQTDDLTMVVVKAQ